jgi:hypothetical protein
VVYEHTGEQEEQMQDAGSQVKTGSAKMMKQMQGRPGPDAGRAQDAQTQKKMNVQGRSGPDAGRAPAAQTQKKMNVNWPCRAKADGGGTETTQNRKTQKNETEKRQPDKVPMMKEPIWARVQTVARLREGVEDSQWIPERHNETQ